MTSIIYPYLTFVFNGYEHLNPTIIEESKSLIPRYSGPINRRKTNKTAKQLKARARAKHNKKHKA